MLVSEWVIVMDINLELARLDTANVSQSKRTIQRWRVAMESMHSPELLAALLEHQLATGSVPALRVLLGLKDNHSEVYTITSLETAIETDHNSFFCLGFFCKGQRTPSSKINSSSCTTTSGWNAKRRGIASATMHLYSPSYSLACRSAGCIK